MALPRLIVSSGGPATLFPALLAAIISPLRVGFAMRLARGGPSWILVPSVLALLCVLTAWQQDVIWLYFLAAPLVVIALFFTWFFRDPERAPSAGLASPADGHVSRLERITDPDVGDAERIAIFMSPIDVHVNRFPLSGRVERVTLIPGTHAPAFDKDSDANERVETVLMTEHGRVKVVQIAGTVARRIVPYIVKGQGAIKGERMGLIRFGSRCDVIMAVGTVAAWNVKVGDKVLAGTTSLATLAQGTVAPGAR